MPSGGRMSVDFRYLLAGKKYLRPAPSLDLFASPDHLDPDLKLFLDEASSRLCAWLANAGQSGPLPSLSVLPDVSPSIEGLPAKDLLDDLQLVMEGAYQPSHPGALAHLDPPPLTASIVADLICAGLNNNLLAEELSPSLSRLERQICNWFAERIGMPSGSGGVAASGGTLSNLMALVLARHKAGLQNDPSAVVLASQDAHVSFVKAARVMGLSSDSFQKVKVDSKGQISIRHLQEQLTQLRVEGRRCFAVVATAGTTIRGAIDPLQRLHEICSKDDLWLHVDGAIGGIFSLCNSTAHLLKGLSKANSITLNPQKLLGIAKTSSLLLVANKVDLISTFSTGLPYIEPPWGEEVHGGEIGLQGSRSGEVLKLWLGLRQLGEKGIQSLLEQAIYRRNYLEQKLNTSKLNINSGPLHLLACTPHKLDNRASEKWATETRRKLLDNKFLVSRPVQNGRHFLKIVLGNPHTQLSHLDQLSVLMNQSVES